MDSRRAVNTVAIILASSVSTSLVLVTTFALYVAMHADAVDSARVIAVTQVLTGWGGGMLGVLGTYVGYTLGYKKANVADDGGQPRASGPSRPSAPFS